jgi:hypothetical protein
VVRINEQIDVDLFEKRFWKARVKFFSEVRVLVPEITFYFDVFIYFVNVRWIGVYDIGSPLFDGRSPSDLLVVPHYIDSTT